MNQAIATIIAALIAGAASVAVAWITVRGKPQTSERGEREAPLQPRAPEAPRTAPKGQVGVLIAVVYGILTFVALLSLIFAGAIARIQSERTASIYVAIAAIFALIAIFAVRKSRHD